MIDKILQKYTNQVAENGTDAVTPDEAEAADDLGAFGWMRGVRDRAIMLELRKKNGNILAVGYSWLEKVSFDPSEGITLHLAGQQIKISGRNLNADLGQRVRLFQGITRQRVPWIQEADEPALLKAANGATVVEDIEW